MVSGKWNAVKPDEPREPQPPPIPYIPPPEPQSTNDDWLFGFVALGCLIIIGLIIEGC